jgi:hypothetical protein
MKKTHIALVAAGVAALAGGGTAIAAKGHTHTVSRPLTAAFRPGPPGLGAAAAYLGTTADALHTQLESGKTLAEIAAATSGKSATGLIAALVADAKAALGANAPSDLTERITALVNGHQGMHGLHGPQGGHVRGLDAAATYLGTTAEALRTQLQSGKTLAQIANATSGKSAAGLIDALVADARTHITAEVNGTR